MTTSLHFRGREAVPTLVRPAQRRGGRARIRASRWLARLAGTAFVCGAALGLVSRVAEGADESSPGAEHRTVVDATAYPWSAIGAMFNSDHTECTAVAVAADQILTAAHCLYGHRTGHLMTPASLHVLMGFVRGAYAVDATVSSYHVAAAYERTRPAGTYNADWAVLNLKNRLPSGWSVAVLAKRIPQPGTLVMAGGYGRGRAFMMTADPECQILSGSATGMLLSNCHIAPGYSGGPLLVRASGTEKAEVVGINIGTSMVGGAQVTVAVPTPLVRWELGMVVSEESSGEPAK